GSLKSQVRGGLKLRSCACWQLGKTLFSKLPPAQIPASYESLRALVEVAPRYWRSCHSSGSWRREVTSQFHDRGRSLMASSLHPVQGRSAIIPHVFSRNGLEER